MNTTEMLTGALVAGVLTYLALSLLGFRNRWPTVVTVMVVAFMLFYLTTDQTTLS